VELSIKRIKMQKYLYVSVILIIGILTSCTPVYSNSPAISRAYGKQQIKARDRKNNTILVTPNYKSYADRNNNVSEKVVAIYDKRSPAYGYRYIIYTPIGRYIGHHKILQQSPNGYGYEEIPDGGEGSETPCFESIEAAKKYYYPELYR